MILRLAATAAVSEQRVKQLEGAKLSQQVQHPFPPAPSPRPPCPA